MRENTRCEVDEPISTPTLRMQISSSPSRLRPVEEKKMRPPCSSVSIFIKRPICPSCVLAAILRDGASRLLRMRFLLVGAAQNQLGPHPEERALARVSKD